ncbi:MAG: helix-turn-helix domain-containing protein [Planctomycetaceae bacterium]
MSKKYIELDEAARSLGMSTDELNRLRERGEIRGFADRGNWKFKAEDVEEFGRSRQADSSPDVPMLGGGSRPASGGAKDTLSPPSDSDVRLMLDDNLVGGGQPVAQHKGPGLSDSDSDVKLVGSDSDSDIRIAPQKPPASLADSDSDVRIFSEDASRGDRRSDVGTDSDVKLLSDDEPSGRSDSDSDVKLVGDTGLDLDLAGEGGSSVLADDSRPGLGDDAGMTIAAGSDMLRADGDVSLEGLGSGISLDAPDSSIRLQGADSGRGGRSPSDTADSSVILDARDDSGISLAGPSDSGISLSSEADLLLGDDSGISLQRPGDSGITLGPGSEDELEQTVPLLDSDDVFGEQPTRASIPAGKGVPDSEFELEMTGDSDDGDTSVILFEDEEADDFGATVVKKKSAEAPLDLAEEEDFAYDDEFADDDLEVATDIEGEDDELLDDGVFDEEEDVEGSFVSGGHEGFAVPGGRVAAPAQAEWGAGTFAGLVLSTVALVLVGILSYDLVRSMWGWQEPAPVNSYLLDQLRGLFG